MKNTKKKKPIVLLNDGEKGFRDGCCNSWPDPYDYGNDEYVVLYPRPCEV